MSPHFLGCMLHCCLAQSWIFIQVTLELFLKKEYLFNWFHSPPMFCCRKAFTYHDGATTVPHSRGGIGWRWAVKSSTFVHSNQKTWAKMGTETWIFIFCETFTSFLIESITFFLSMMQQIDRDKPHKWYNGFDWFICDYSPWRTNI